MKAWYFSGTDKKLRYGDGRSIEAGVTHTVTGKLELCSNGLHASERLIDALRYAPGPYVWEVELSGEILHGDDKCCASERTYIRGFDATELLREFSRKQALINIEKIAKYCFQKDYDLIIQYLETGDEEIRSEAESAAWYAAESAAWYAARSAAWYAARSAAESAAESTAESAAWYAAWYAARSAAWYAAWYAADEMLTKMVLSKFNEMEQGD